MPNFQAFTPANPRKPVFTFNARDLAEAYRDRMARIGCDVTIKVERMARRVA